MSEQGTDIAAAKAAKLKQDFQNWIWADPARTERLVATYNGLLRSTVEPKFPDWAVSTAGLTDRWKQDIRPEQLAAVARTVFGGNTLLAYGVGRGKTLMGTVSCMEKRRLGVRADLIVAPNRLVEQWATSTSSTILGPRSSPPGPTTSHPRAGSGL